MPLARRRDARTDEEGRYPPTIFRQFDNLQSWASFMAPPL
jgi:hypothetical protein